MSADRRGSNVVKFKLSAAAAQAQIRALAQDSEAVIITDHAGARMEQRGIVMRDVLRILRTGYVDEPPEEIRDGDWKCKITQAIGSREAGAVTIIVSRRQLLVVKTVEWEDGR